MADDISLVVGVDYKELTGLIKTSEQSKRVLKSIAQEFARTGDQKAYMSAVMRVVMAQKTLGKESQLTQSKIMKLGAQMKQEAVFAEQLSKATNRAGTAMQQTGRRTNQLGVLMQQSGYQIGDFAIQVQSGTNYMVAFGQQATQLVGTFAMLAKSTRMIALFSGLGIALPILTAIGAYFIRAKDNADSANGSFEDVKQTLQELSDIDKGLGIGSDMVSNADVAITKFTSILTIMRNIQAVRLSEQLAEPLDALREEFKEFSRQVQYAAISQTEAPEFKILGFEDQSRAIQAFQILADIQGKTKEELQDSVVQQTLFLRGSGLLTEEVKKILATYGDVVGVVGAATKTQDDLNDSQEKSYKRFDAHTVAWQKHQDKIAKANTDAQQELDLLIQKNVLLDLELQYGKDSSVYKLMALGYEKDNLRTKLEAAGVEQKIIDATLKALGIQASLTQEISDSADAAERLKNNLEIASSFRVGGDLGEFANVAGGLDAFGGPGSFKYGGSQKFKPEPESDQKAQKSDLQRLRERLDLEDALLGKTEARQRVIQALGVKFVEDNPKTVAGLEAQITANENLLRIEEERKRMNDLVTDSMENGLMAMADGTKTVSAAFRDMAREIIAELYRVLVVQQMVNAAKSFFGLPFADGGAFSGGSQIQAYADGGVVGSPTLFPMAGGKTGLMGEAGPEAIMPLKRGANGKLGVQMEGGGGDNVVINQSFNFQANGDDSVKKIIAQAAPQIAQMTKNSMLNDRRRGGTTKAVFG